ncbi:MAG: hypothetical protein ACJ74O_16325 [Frankiaceae bacterium]
MPPPTPDAPLRTPHPLPPQPGATGSRRRATSWASFVIGAISSPVALLLATEGRAPVLGLSVAGGAVVLPALVVSGRHRSVALLGGLAGLAAGVTICVGGVVLLLLLALQTGHFG